MPLMAPQVESSTGLEQSGHSGVMYSQPSTGRACIGAESSIEKLWFPVDSHVAQSSFLYLYSTKGSLPAGNNTSTDQSFAWISGHG